MQKITPSLWFDTQAEEAGEFYTSVFPDGRIGRVARYTEAGPGEPGTVLTVTFTLMGVDFTAINGGPVYSFTPAVSFVVNCETQQEVDYYYDGLREGGEEVQCGWITDKFGLSWQIVPTALGRLMADDDPAVVERVTSSMLQMKKLVIADLERAARGE